MSHRSMRRAEQRANQQWQKAARCSAAMAAQREKQQWDSRWGIERIVKGQKAVPTDARTHARVNARIAWIREQSRAAHGVEGGAAG